MSEEKGKYNVKGLKEKAKAEHAKLSEQAETAPVNLCAKVPKHYRQHWAAEAKRTGTSMTAVIIEALTQEFGLPKPPKLPK